MIQDIPQIALDLDGWYRNMRREGMTNRVFYFEHGVDETIQNQLDERFLISGGLNKSCPHYPDLRRALIHRFLGQEFFRVFPEGAEIKVPTKGGNWAEESVGMIADWEDLERFKWPHSTHMDTSMLEYYEKNLPEDMRVFVVMKPWEITRDLIGFENLCYKLFEDRNFIRQVLKTVSEFYLAIVNRLCDFDCFGAVYVADDLGFKTSTMISVDDIRDLILPWHKQIAAFAHQKNKLFLFHSCGQIYDVLDAYIDEVKIDAKHSFEDVIKPVTDAKREYGDRLTLLGGMDVDFLARSDEHAIRRKTRQLLDICLPGGGYFLGTGNWVTSYIPLDNYLVMLDEARRCTT